MSRSNFNLEELERRFDELLASFTEEDIKEWDQFDEAQIRLEKFFCGDFQPVEIIETETSTNARDVISIMDMEIINYEVNLAS